jgi:D-galactose 1-dehydrogenase
LAGKHVFLEKPPGATLSEVEVLIALADQQNITLFASWHSRASAAVPLAKQYLAQADIISVHINWKEDVRVWHPGQSWIWEPGGFGVFDPGINALSILTAILPEPVRLIAAELQVPSNCAAPIKAQLRMESASAIPISAEFDFLQTGPQSWDIIIETAQGQMLLAHGGNTLTLPGAIAVTGADQEYPALYRNFVDLVRSGKSEVDLAPLRLVADAFLVGRTTATDSFYD